MGQRRRRAREQRRAGRRLGHPHGRPGRVPLGDDTDRAGRTACVRVGWCHARRPRGVRPAPGQPAHRRRDGAHVEAAVARCRGPRRRDDRQHLSGLGAARPVQPRHHWRGCKRRPRAAARVRCRPHLCRPSCPHSLGEESTHVTARDPRRARRDRERHRRRSGRGRQHREDLPRRPRRRLAVDGRDRHGRRGQVRHPHPRRRPKGPQDGRRRGQLHREGGRFCMTDVVVTGLGATSPVGGDVSSTWDALLAGRSGARRLDADWAADLPVQIAAPVAVEPADVLDRVEARTLDRAQQFALVAAREAWADAGLGDASVDPERLAVAVASGIGGVLTLLAQYDVLRERGARRVSPHTVPMLMPNGPAATVGLELTARAGVHAPVSACASGAEAIALALDMLRAGRADVVVAGGTEAANHPLPIAGFASMRALSMRDGDPQEASRPYDKARDGFVLGEGAGIVVVESAEHAERRGATIYAELAGAGMSADAYHVAAPEPTGAGAARALSLAMRDAGLTPADIAHVNAHATSTPLGDVAEASALRTALGDAVSQVCVTATKSCTGHLLGAAGALEAVVTVLSLANRLVPATRNLDDPDDEVALDVVRMSPRQLPASAAALSNSFGFGGHNVTLAFKAV